MPRKPKAAGGGAPEWMVTYGDMMSLLLCFFVIIVSLSEVKEDERFHEVMNSIRTAFGYDGQAGTIPVEVITKNSLVQQLQQIVLPSRVRNEGDSDHEGIDGRVFRVTSVREGINLEVGGRIAFDRFEAVLKPEAEELIAKLAAKVVGHNTIIKVRGHTTQEPLPSDSRYRDADELAYERARTVADALQRAGIRRERIRTVSAGSHEPLVAQAYDERRRAFNRRVEIIVTEAVVDDYSGQPLPGEERDPGHGG